MGKGLWEKGLVIGIFLLVTCVSGVSETENIIIEKNVMLHENLGGNILYVGGTGPNNYTKIQDAIDNASDGDTIFVYDGSSPYYENIDIDKSISLIGENEDTTIIDGNKSGDVVKITAKGVTLSCFTIQNSGEEQFDFGVEIQSDCNKILRNSIKNNGGLNDWICGGIFLINSSHNEIGNNLIYSNGREGIHMDKADYNNIHNNTIHENDYFAIIVNASSYNIIQNNDMSKNYVCMSFWPFSHDNQIIGNSIHDHGYYSLSFYTLSDNNIVRFNNFSNNIEWSIRIAGANKNLIEYNTISGSSGGSWGYGYGIRLEYTFQNIIRCNNIRNNKNNAMILNSFSNQWMGNYWDDYKGFGPKVIWGNLVFSQASDFHIPWVNFDWHPSYVPIEW